MEKVHEQISENTAPQRQTIARQYCTPVEAIRALMAVERLPKSLPDPCCGSDAMTGNVVRPHDVRWVAAKGPLGWVIRDTWTPGDFCMGYKTEAAALADARERNKKPSGPSAWAQDDGEEVPLMTIISSLP